MWRISFWLFFSIGYIIINNSIKADFNPYRPNRLHFLPYFNPRSPCGERLIQQFIALLFTNDFNPRSPCGERLSQFCGVVVCIPFQSTLPVRGATRAAMSGPSAFLHPRSPCGERPMSTLSLNSSLDFNPRSPCGERPRTWHTITPKQPFQSTLPVRGATICVSIPYGLTNISIHAPRAGSDIDGEWLTTRETNFNPRSPCGERHYLKERPCDIWAFQSTLPVRGATAQR